MSVERELPLIIVACCTRYVVSELHPVPRCPTCWEIPRYVEDTAWWLEMEPPIQGDGPMW